MGDPAEQAGDGLYGGPHSGAHEGRVTLDATLAMAAALGQGGIDEGPLREGRELTRGAQAALEERRAAGDLAWMDLPYQNVGEVLEFAQQCRGRFETLLVLGIGGSALGTIALGTALLHPYHNVLSAAARQGRPRLFVLDNVDPDQTAALFDVVDWQTTLVNVVSKSGGTAETAAAYLLARAAMEERLGGGVQGRDAARSRLVFTTDPRHGVLRDIAQEEGISAFEVPPGVGGRFSVLSPVGLLPAAVCGMDVAALLGGARAMDECIQTEQGAGNPAGLFALVQYLEYVHFGRRISVMMPYSAGLRDVADWYRQLWAESLGKAVDKAGRPVGIGPTPVKALGATDQHSQIQLYAEGPDDKVVTFLRVASFANHLAMPALHEGRSEFSYLIGSDLAGLLNAEQEATAWALARRGRPSLRIDVPRVDAWSLGQLLFMLEYATALAGELFNVNAFDQPGVELGKQATYALMGRPGYEAVAEDIRGREGAER